MQEVTFIHERAKRWKAMEKAILSNASVAPDELASFYIELTDDLAYAQTHYPTSKTVAYLNELTVRMHSSIYKNKKEKASRFLYFFSREIPLAIKQVHPFLLASLVIFCLAIFIGFLSGMQDETFVNAILGDYYVSMTESNIEAGDPFGVYKDDNRGLMFYNIGTNNIRVAFLAFVGGFLLGVFTWYILMANGIMVGAFMALFARNDLLIPFLNTVFIHGALELSAIVIAGGAGLVIGTRVLFPGTYPRMYALINGARSAAKVMVGLVPVFIAAAWLESFVTGAYQHIADVFQWLIVLLSFAYVYYYFVWLPNRLNPRPNA